jgi:hypothetical protein
MAVVVVAADWTSEEEELEVVIVHVAPPFLVQEIFTSLGLATNIASSDDPTSSRRGLPGQTIQLWLRY